MPGTHLAHHELGCVHVIIVLRQLAMHACRHCAGGKPEYGAPGKQQGCRAAYSMAGVHQSINPFQDVSLRPNGQQKNHLANKAAQVAVMFPHATTMSDFAWH